MAMQNSVATIPNMSKRLSVPQNQNAHTTTCVSVVRSQRTENDPMHDVCSGLCLSVCLSACLSLSLGCLTVVVHVDPDAVSLQLLILMMSQIEGIEHDHAKRSPRHHLVEQHATARRGLKSYASVQDPI
jgi:hypothetical protein